MTRLNIFVTPEELESVRTAQKVSGMYLSGGIPMGNPAEEVARLIKKYGLPEESGFDPSNGEFVTP